jgi:uncharacterized phage protein (TIGR01671 family)
MKLNFRAFKKSSQGRKIMREVVVLNLGVDVEVFKPRTPMFEQTTVFWDWDKIHLMQYTGLKDKNGVEIYEGDILEYVSPEYVGDDERIDRYVVEWVGYGFEARWINPPQPNFSSDGHLSLKTPDEDMKIIGNIYENPDLLEVA